MNETKPVASMTPQEGRIAIAKDVLAHLDVVRPQEGVYLFSRWLCEQDVNLDEPADVESISKGCEVCALGACFLSYVRLFDGKTNNDMYQR